MRTYIELVDKRHIIIRAFSQSGCIAKNLNFKDAEQAEKHVQEFLKTNECKQIEHNCWMLERENEI